MFHIKNNSQFEFTIVNYNNDEILYNINNVIFTQMTPELVGVVVWTKCASYDKNRRLFLNFFYLCIL